MPFPEKNSSTASWSHSGSRARMMPPGQCHQLAARLGAEHRLAVAAEFRLFPDYAIRLPFRDRMVLFGDRMVLFGDRMVLFGDRMVFGRRRQQSPSPGPTGVPLQHGLQGPVAVLPRVDRSLPGAFQFRIGLFCGALHRRFSREVPVQPWVRAWVLPPVRSWGRGPDTTAGVAGTSCGEFMTSGDGGAARGAWSLAKSSPAVTPPKTTSAKIMAIETAILLMFTMSPY